MSVPLHPEEQRFNCAHAGFLVKRTRDPLIDGEPSEGAFVVWRTLGFGGKPNPLVFSRVASFAARTAQALFGCGFGGGHGGSRSSRSPPAQFTRTF